MRATLASVSSRWSACRTIPHATVLSARRNNSSASPSSAIQPLTSFRRAVANGEADIAHRELQHLLASDHSLRLSTRDLRDISTFLTASQAASTPSLSLNEFALNLASRGQPSVLEPIMLSLLKEKRHSDVLLLWRELELRLTRLPIQTPTTLLAPTSPPLSSPIDNNATKALENTLSITLAAFAALSDRNSALRIGTGIHSGIPLKGDRVERLIRRVLPPEMVALTLQYVEDIRIARLLEHPRQASSLYSSLFDRGDVDAAIRLLRDMMAGVEQGWIAPVHSATPPQQPGVIVSMTEAIWSVVIGGFMRCGRPEVARFIWDEMARLNVPRTAVTWNALLEGYSQRGQYDELVRVWGQMDAAGVTKDVFTYTTVISALFEAKRSDEAMRLWKELRIKGFPQGSLGPPDSPPSSGDPNHPLESPLSTHSSPIVPYNAVIHGLLISARLDDALALLNEMRENGPPPDITTLNTFIRYHSRKADMGAIASLLRQLPELHIRPDVFTFTSVLHACLRSGIPASEAVKRVESAMSASGISPNVVTYSAIIDQTVRQGGRDNIQAGFEWLDAMEQRGFKANEVTFTTLLAALQRDQTLPPEYVERKMREIDSRMRAKGARRNRVTYNILIKASLSHASDEGLAAAVLHYRQMIRDGIRANDDTWYLLLNGALVRKAFKEGAELLADMDASGFVPNGALERIVKRLRGT